MKPAPNHSFSHTLEVSLTINGFLSHKMYALCLVHSSDSGHNSNSDFHSSRHMVERISA